jgi:hypothetical protein
MVGAAVAVGLEGAAELGGGEGRDGLIDQQFLGREIELLDGGAELSEQGVLVGELVGVGVEAADLTEEDLALDAEGLPDADDLGDCLELLAELVARAELRACEKPTPRW